MNKSDYQRITQPGAMGAADYVHWTRGKLDV